jgi:hypothetical protein
MIAIADLETFLGIAAGTDLALLLELESASVEWFGAQTDRYFGAAAETTQVVEGNGQRDLYLAEVPDPAEDIEVIEQAYPGDDTEEVTASDEDGFVVRDQHLARKGGYVWSLGYEYLVTYTRGYVETAPAVAGVTPADIAAPDAVRQAVKQIVAFWYNAGEPGDGASQKTSETMGNYSYTRGALFTNPDAMLNGIPGLRQTIATWRQPRV